MSLLKNVKCTAATATATGCWWLLREEKEGNRVNNVKEESKVKGSKTQQRRLKILPLKTFLNSITT